MIVDHIGIVVSSINEGLRHWEKVFGYKQLTQEIINTRQMVKVMLLYKEKSLLVKLVEPLSIDSPVYSFAQRGGGLHHLCFKCDNLKEELNRMQALGLRIIAPSQPGEAFDNEDIAFVFVKHGLNIELIDTEKKSAILTAIHDEV